MPAAIPKPCARPGCPEIVTSRYCAAHQSEEYRRLDKRKGDKRQRYSTTRWRRFRAHILRKRPICQECHRAASNEVAHIIPWDDEPELAYDPDNVRALCKPCHSRESAERGERWGERKGDAE